MPGQLAGLIRAKYPGAYDDMDDATLEKSVLAKYPEYQDLATPEAQGPGTFAMGRSPVTSDATAPREPDTYWGGFRKGLSDYAGEIGQSLFKSTAQPETTGDFLGLMIPAAAGQGAALGQAAGNQGRAFLRGAKGAPTMRQGIGRGVAEMARDAFGGPRADAAAVNKFRGGPAPVVRPAPPLNVRSGTLRMDPVDKMMESARPAPSNATGSIRFDPERPAPPPTATGSIRWDPLRPDPNADYPRGGTTPAPAPVPGAAESASAPIPASPGMSAAERARLVRQGFSPDVIAKIEAIEAAQPPMIRGRLQMGPPATPPIQVDQASLPQSWRDLPHPLDPQRVDVGAEVTGRAHGMTKQEVRDVATPILDAKPGEASPILPEGVLERIIDTLKKLPRGGPEREAYVARATSGKAQWQIENIRRTLEHLGLLVPVAAAAPSLRDEVMKRLSGGSGRQ